MYDNEFSEEVEQDTALETDTETIEDDVPEVETEESAGEEEQAEGGEETLAAPEKIKLGEKEYTPAELEELVKTQETQKAEAAKNTYQPRELGIIEADLTRESANLENEALALQKKYVALGNEPVDAEGNSLGFTAEDAYNHGLKTGQWDYFLACLTPHEAVEFEKSRYELGAEYGQKLQYLNQEKEYISFQQKKKEDLSKWDSYIETNLKESKGASHMLNKLKSNFSFDEKGVKDFLQWFEEAKVIDLSNKQQSGVNEAAKQASMNSSITSSKPAVKSHIFSDVEVEEMTQKEYAKHEKEIDRQIKAGIFKVTQ